MPLPRHGAMPRWPVPTPASVVLALLAFAASVVPAVTQPAPEGGKIAFVRTGNIYVMNADGTGQTALTSYAITTVQDEAADPAWSPDGTRIAFSRHATSLSASEIFVMEADGDNVANVSYTPERHGDYEPAWSPDGTKIAFRRLVFESIPGEEFVNTQFDVFVMNADGSNQVNLTNTGISLALGTTINERHPSWSPDGTKIVFVREAAGAGGLLGLELHVMNADGSALTALTRGFRRASQPVWSPDGTRIAFTGDDHPLNQQVYVVNADGTNLTRLTSAPADGAWPSWSSDGTKIAFSGFRGGTSRDIYVMDADGSNPTRLTSSPVNDIHPAWQPAPRCTLLLVPGIAGTYAANPADDLSWLLHRGAHPDQLRIDPLGRVYDDLITTLGRVGYVRDQDFFVVNYDWRLPPAPFDGVIDGQVTGLSGYEIADGDFAHAVDYFGHYLRKAAEAQEARSPGSRLECVDVIAHSTGGLVTRAYIQSTAYMDDFVSADGDRTLPRVNQFIMLGVPNRGASKAWNPLHDNWVVDPIYRAVLSKIVNRAFQKVLAGRVIGGPDYLIARSDILDGTGTPDPARFIRLYAPTMASLLATYDFLDTGAGFTNVNSDPAWRNSLVLDLNNGFDLTGTIDPSPFAEQTTATVIYGTDHATATSVIARQGPSGATGVIAPFADFLARDPRPGETWYQDLQPNLSGDGTVPTESAAGQFFGDSRVTLRPLSAATTTGKTDHTGLVGNRDVQATILTILGRPFDPAQIAHGSAPGSTALSVIFDPVEGVVRDGLGRRLGYTGATGPLTEIPTSVWFGTTDGFGLVYDPVVTPLTLDLVGLGEDHYVQVTLVQDEAVGGAVSTGVLAVGEVRTVPVSATLPSPELHLPAAALVVGDVNTITGTGFTTGSVVKLYVATAGGAVSHGPFTPSAVDATALTWTIPATVGLGNGFGSLQVVNTDRGYAESNVVGTLLVGHPPANLPTILAVDAVPLAEADLAIGLAHADTVVTPGSPVTLAGTGFNSPGVNLFTAAGNLGPLWPLAGGTATSLTVVVPAGAPAGPGTFQVVNSPFTGNVASNAVASVLRARVTITGVTVAAGTVTVTGTGFSPLSVINLFNLQAGGAVNLGGLAGATPKIPLAVVSDTQFTFSVPAGAVAGPAFLEVINPPFIPFASSGTDPDGAFTLP